MNTSGFLRALGMLTGIVVVGLGGAACYTPPTESGVFKCDQPTDACPTGLQCVAGLCRTRVDDPGVMLPPATEPTVKPPPAGVGCKMTSTLLANVDGLLMVACTGSFTAGGAAGLCATGYHLCATKSTDDALLAAASTSGRCTDSKLAGFYAAEQSGILPATGPLLCPPKTGSGRTLLFGCGTESGTLPYLDGGCKTLQTAAACETGGAVPGWSCTDKLGTASHTGSDRGGVLCCQDKP